MSGLCNLVNVRKSECPCGHAFYSKHSTPLTTKSTLSDGARKAKKRALETEEESIQRRVSCKAKRRALETDEERMKRRVSDNACTTFLCTKYTLA